jgi:hypothetical protein
MRELDHMLDAIAKRAKYTKLEESARKQVLSLEERKRLADQRREFVALDLIADEIIDSDDENV